MSALIKAPYVFVAHGKVLFAGESPEELFTQIEERALGGAAVKSWRVHCWATSESQDTSILTCLACKEQRRHDGSNNTAPCPFPERFDPSIEVIKPESSVLVLR